MEACAQLRHPYGDIGQRQVCVIFNLLHADASGMLDPNQQCPQQVEEAEQNHDGKPQ